MMQATTPVETPTKSSGNTEQGLVKKLKGFDGLTMSLGNGTAESAEGVSEPRSQRFVKILRLTSIIKEIKAMP